MYDKILYYNLIKRGGGILINLKQIFRSAINYFRIYNQFDSMEDYNNFLKENYKKYSSTGIRLTIFIIFVEIFFIMITSKGTNVLDTSRFPNYIFLYASMIFVSILVTIITFYLKKQIDTEKGLTGFKLCSICHSFLYLLLTSTIAILDLQQGFSVNVYITFVLMIPFTIYLHPITLLFELLINYIFMLILMLHIFTLSPAILSASRINITTCSIFALLIGITSTHAKIKEFTNHNMILKQNQQLSNLNLQLRSLADKDPLTKLFNRSSLLDTAEEMILMSHEKQSVISFLMFDIDNFKSVNDTYGHGTGDVCIRIIANIITTVFQDTGAVAFRYGGEEFLVLLPYKERNEVLRLANLVLTSVSEHKIGNIKESITISGGIRFCHPNKSDDPFIYINHADEALYLSKKNGKNRVTFYQIE